MIDHILELAFEEWRFRHDTIAMNDDRLSLTELRPIWIFCLKKEIILPELLFYANNIDRHRLLKISDQIYPIRLVRLLLGALVHQSIAVGEGIHSLLLDNRGLINRFIEVWMLGLLYRLDRSTLHLLLFETADFSEEAVRLLLLFFEWWFLI